MTSKLRFTKKKKESPPKKKKKSSPTKKKEVEPAKKEMTLPTGKKKRGRSSSAEEHEADDSGSSSQPTKRPRLTSNRNPKNLQSNPAAASASPTQPDNEETPLGPPATSEDPPPTKRQNPPHQQDPPDASISQSSTKGGTPYSEQGDNEEMGSHGEPPRLREPNATEEQIMEISNILKPTGSETDLSVEIFDDGLWDDVDLGDDGDIDDPIVDGWNKIIIHDQVKILWEDLYKMDVKTRKIEHEPERICEELEGPRVCEETEAGCESLETRVAQLEESMKVRDDIIGQLEARIKSMEDDRNPGTDLGTWRTCLIMIVLTLVEAKKMMILIKMPQRRVRLKPSKWQKMMLIRRPRRMERMSLRKKVRLMLIRRPQRRVIMNSRRWQKMMLIRRPQRMEKMSMRKIAMLMLIRRPQRKARLNPSRWQKMILIRRPMKEVENDPGNATASCDLILIYFAEDLEVMVAAAEKFEKEVVEKKSCRERSCGEESLGERIYG
uniref:DUF287 domain-containing protein n=1 Tax=Brassica campestris TaxID=3711 RepID=A0A3P5YRI0_BRACM|nr:unnamed protein product [Brassica rapa]